MLNPDHQHICGYYGNDPTRPSHEQTLLTTQSETTQLRVHSSTAVLSLHFIIDP